MTEPTPTIHAAKRAKKPLWRRILKWTLRAAVVLVVLVIAAWAITNYWAANKINEGIAQIRAAGEPLTFADLEAMSPHVDPEKDAARFYSAAGDLVRGIDYGEGDTGSSDYGNAFRRRNQFPLNRSPSPEVFAAAHLDAERNRLAFGMLDRGSAFTECNFDLQMEHGISVFLPIVGKMRNVADAAGLRTRLAAYEQKGDEASRDLISSLGLIRVFSRQPGGLSTLVQWAVANAYCKDATVVLERGHPSDDALRSLDAAFAGVHLIQAREFLIGERVYFLELTMGQSPNWHPNPEVAPLPESNRWGAMGVIGRVLIANGISHWAKFIAAVGDNWPAAVAAADATAAQPLSALDALSVEAPSLQRPILIGAQTVSALNSTRVAIQIERYRLAHAGALPETLDKLPEFSALPLDPLTSKPLIYTKTPDGYCVYSAGHNSPADSDNDPIKWSDHWGIHIRISAP